MKEIIIKRIAKRSRERKSWLFSPDYDIFSAFIARTWDRNGKYLTRNLLNLVLIAGALESFLIIFLFFVFVVFQMLATFLGEKFCVEDGWWKWFSWIVEEGGDDRMVWRDALHVHNDSITSNINQLIWKFNKMRIKQYLSMYLVNHGGVELWIVWKTYFLKLFPSIYSTSSAPASQLTTMAQNLANAFFSSLFSSSFHHKLSMLRLSVFVVCALIFSFFSPPAAYIFSVPIQPLAHPLLFIIYVILRVGQDQGFSFFQPIVSHFFFVFFYAAAAAGRRHRRGSASSTHQFTYCASVADRAAKSSSNESWNLLISINIHGTGTAGRRRGFCSVMLFSIHFFSFVFFVILLLYFIR